MESDIKTEEVTHNFKKESSFHINVYKPLKKGREIKTIS